MFLITASRAVRLLPFSILLLAGDVQAQMTPLADLRKDDCHVFYQQDGEDYQVNTPGASFGYWEDQTTAVAEVYQPCPDDPTQQCLVGQCSGSAFQFSEFFPAGIQFSGGTGASWGIPPSGLWSVSSMSGFKFATDTTLVYDLTVIMDQGDARSVDGNTGGAVYLKQYHAGGTTDLYFVADGQPTFKGRIGPGTYELFGFSQKVGGLENFQGTTYFAQWTVHKPAVPHIARQPGDLSAGCGGTVVFSVGTTLPQGNYTYQWRRNLVPLTNGPGVSGATTATLTLTNVCTAADYDVVVTGPDPSQGGLMVAEPSRLAHLTIISTPTGVATEPTSAQAITVRAPAPNPFRASTSIDYEARKPARLVATVYNAAGAQVRSLADRPVSGAGSVTWDGRLRSGARAPVGIYFIRVELGDVRTTGKVILLE